MRLALVAALCSALLIPAAASARSHNPAVCQYIARKLVYYDNLKVHANDLKKDQWVAAIKKQISETEYEFAVECPELAAEQRTAQQLAMLLKMAGRTALSFFTFGAMPM